MNTQGTREPAASSPTRLLEGKVAIITGASRGIGAVAARAFAAAGAAVVLAARDEGALAAVAEQITSAGGLVAGAGTTISSLTGNAGVAKGARRFGRRLGRALAVGLDALGEEKGPPAKKP